MPEHSIPDNLSSQFSCEHDPEKCQCSCKQCYIDTETILKACRSLLNTADREQIVRELFNRCKESIGATAGYVALLAENGEKNEVLFLDAGGLPCSVDPSLPMPIRGLRAEAYAKGEAVFNNDFMDSRWVAMMPPGHVNLDNVLFAPLLSEGYTFGIVGIANKPSRFTQQDARIASLFGGLIALAFIDTKKTRQLEASEKKYRELVEYLSDGLIITDENDTVTFCNHQICEIVGYSSNQLVNHPFNSILDAASAKYASHLFEEVRQTGKKESDFSFMLKNGTRKTLHLKMVATRDDHGKYNGITISVSDITEKQLHLQYIYDLARFPEENVNPVIRITAEGKLIYSNAAAQKIIMQQRDDREITILEHLRQLTKTCITEKKLLHEIIHSEDGSFRFSAAPLPESGYANIYGQDITELLRTEEENRLLQEQLHQLQKLEAIGQLTGGIAHDFNNILGGILGLADLLTEQLPENHPQKKYASRIADSAERGGRIVSQLLSFARKMPLHAEIVNINDIVEKVVLILHHTIDKNITINVRCHKSPLFAEVDTARFENVLLNLGLNARDAMPGGGILTFSVSTERIDESFCKLKEYELVPGSYIRLSVTDTGIGMCREIKKHIFEPFFTTKEVGKGTGLGLSSVYGCIKQHGGFIECTSESGRGTEFSLYIPYRNAAAAETENNLKIGMQADTIKVLVVDDDTIISETIKEYLDGEGLEVHLCRDGAEAIELFRKNPMAFDFVLLDLIMPKMDGVQCFHMLKQINPDVQVIVSSGYSKEGKAQHLLDCGAAGFLQKPFRIHTLIHSLIKAIQQRKLHTYDDTPPE